MGGHPGLKKGFCSAKAGSRLKGFPFFCSTLNAFGMGKSKYFDFKGEKEKGYIKKESLYLT